MNNSYIEMNEFPLKWRFTDNKFKLLPQSDLNKLLPLSPECSSQRWKEWISEQAEHYMLVPQKAISDDNLIIGNCSWNDKEKEIVIRDVLSQSMNLEDSKKITFFWGIRTSIETEWGIFLKYWSDFCYPSDDSNILIIHDSDKAIVYVEDKLWIVDRSKFGKLM